MSATRAAAATATLALLTFGLAACGGGDDKAEADSPGSPDLGPEPSGTTEATETTSPRGPKPLPTRYPEVGLEYDGLPEVEDRYRDAVEVFVAFDRGRLQLMREARMNPLLSDNAAPQVVETFAGTADYLVDHDAHYRGNTVTSFEDVTAEGDLLGLDLCLDGTELRYVEGGRAAPPDGPARVPFRVVVTDTGGSWIVTEAGTREGTC